MDQCNAMDQHVIKMSALGRKFQLGDLYNYCTDHILTEYRLKSDDLPSGTRTETGFDMKLLCLDSDITNKWQHMGLDEHLQASILAELFETEAEADKLRGASLYVNEKCNPTEVTRTFICRAINKKAHLNLPNCLNHIIRTDRKLTDATHIVVGIAYGAEAYCVLAQDVQDDDEDAQEEITDLLAKVSFKMKNALEEKQDDVQFKEQFTKADNQLVSQTKVRVYADLQTQPVTECTLFDTYKVCLKLVDQVQNLEKAVPVVAVLCPLRNILRANEQLEKKFMYRDVNPKMVGRYCRITMELEQVVCRSESLCLSFKKTNSSRPDLRQATQVVSKFRDLLKNMWKKSIVNARRGGDENDREVEKVVHIAETHHLSKISRLNRWLRFKKAEMVIIEKFENINGITFLADKTQLEKELAFSFDKRHTLVLNIPSLDLSTKDLLYVTQDYVDKNTGLVTGDAADDDSDEDEPPWHLVPSKRKQVLDKIREMVDHVENKKHYGNGVQYFIIPEESDKKFRCSYSIYQADNLLMDNVNHLPTRPTGLRIRLDIGRSMALAIQLNWDYEDLGYPCTFLVEYRLKEDPEASWKKHETPKPGETQLTIILRQGSDIEIRVAAETCIGRSQFSEVIDTETALNINQSIDGMEESAPSDTMEFTTHQLQDASSPVLGVSQDTFSTVIDELKLLRELVTNLTKESNETKSALIEAGNHLEEKMKESMECLTQRFQETDKDILALSMKLKETSAESKRNWMELSKVNDRHKAIVRGPLLQDEAEIAMEKKWFEMIESTYTNVKVMEDLIIRGVNVNAEDIKGRNALHFVCKKNKNENLVELVRLLVANGVDVNAKDKKGRAALHILCQFIQNENLIDVVRLLVENGVDVKTKTFEGETALHLLCENYQNENLIEIVRLFVENGIDVKAKNNCEQNALIPLCQHYHNENLIDIVRLFVANGVDVNSKDNEYGRTALYWLCDSYYRNKNIGNIVCLLVENGVDVKARDLYGFVAFSYICKNFKNEDLINVFRLLIKNGDYVEKNLGQTALYLLCLERYRDESLIDVVQLLMENGVDVNAKSNDGMTALHSFCQHYRNENLIDIVRLLIENGIDVKTKDHKGRTALCMLFENSIKENLIDVVQLLIEYGVDVKARDKNGQTVLHSVCLNYENENLVDLVRLLIANGVNVSAKTYEEGETALHLLCRCHKSEKLIDVVRLFIDNGVDVNAKDKYGDTALHQILCCTEREEKLFNDVVRLLVENGADGNLKDIKGQTALHLFCRFNENEKLFIGVVRLLMENGVGVNAKDNDGKTVLHIVCSKYRKENIIDVVRLLIENGVDINAKDNDGKAALIHLCYNNNNENLIDIIRLFVENGADVNTKAGYGKPQDLIRKYYKLENVKEILKLLGGR